MDKRQAHVEKLAESIGATVVYKRATPGRDRGGLHLIAARPVQGATLFQRAVIVPEVLTIPVINDTIYALTLHELGHLAIVGSPEKMSIETYGECYNRPTLHCFPNIVKEESAAWKWAHANALYWNAEMTAIEQEGFGSYLDTFQRLKEGYYAGY